MENVRSEKPITLAEKIGPICHAKHSGYFCYATL